MGDVHQHAGLHVPVLGGLGEDLAALVLSKHAHHASAPEVIAPGVDLRSGPATSESIVCKVENGDRLALVGREPRDGWYRVIHVASAEEGRIHGRLLELELSEVDEADRPSPFRGRAVAESGPPKVRVRNDGDLQMTLTLGDERHVIAPEATRTIERPPTLEEAWE